MSLSNGEGFAIKRKKENTTIKYTIEYNLYRSKKKKKKN